MQTIRIKNMVCQRCIEAVTHILSQLGMTIQQIKLGEVITTENSPTIPPHLMAAALRERGFQLIVDKDTQTVAKIKALVIDMVHYKEELPIVKNSEYLADKMGMNYQQFSKLFSKQEGITIEKFIILQKIERVKELISYDQLTLSEIAYQLGYSSVQHLSNQFRAVTGTSVSQYKKRDAYHRNPLDKVGS